MHGDRFPPPPHCACMKLPSTIAWLLDEASTATGADHFLAALGARLIADDLPIAGGALTLAVPHPIIARRTWLWRAETGVVIEALGFAGGPLSQAARDWLAELGPVQEDTVGPAPERPSAPRCSMPICATSPPCPRRRSPRR